VSFADEQAVQQKSEKIGEEQAKCQHMADLAQADLAEALPALEEAMKVRNISLCHAGTLQCHILVLSIMCWPTLITDFAPQKIEFCRKETLIIFNIMQVLVKHQMYQNLFYGETR
jgi:hypothetical protein